MSTDGKTIPSRIAISKRLRFEVFKRDGFTCQYCGATPPSVLLQCDHIDPVSNGGPTDIDNLVTACQPCNAGKSDIPLSDIPQSLSERAAEVLEREAQVAGYQAVMKQKRMRVEADAQEVLNAFCKWFDRDGIPRGDFFSIKRFIEKLGLDECVEASEIAFRKFSWSYRSAFKYFCGICWNRIRDQEPFE